MRLIGPARLSHGRSWPLRWVTGGMQFVYEPSLRHCHCRELIVTAYVTSLWLQTGREIRCNAAALDAALQPGLSRKRYPARKLRPTGLHHPQASQAALTVFSIAYSVFR